MEKQIEEMAFDLYQALETENIPYYEIHYLAENLHTKGYRKASYVAREIFAEIEENMTDIKMEFATLRAIGKRQLAKIKEKYESEDTE